MTIEELGIKLGARYECTCGKVHEVYTKKVILDKKAWDRLNELFIEYVNNNLVKDKVNN